ncbi:MAG: XdhC family protein [Pseudomonadota bacterium]
MNKQLVEKLCASLRQGERLVMATIISRQGSTPRTAGTKMLVTADGRGHGTIGGGLLEAQVIQSALAALENGRPAIMTFDLTHDDVAAMDMICGGRLEVLLDPMAPNRETLEVMDLWRGFLTSRAAGFLVTTIIGDRVERALLSDDGRLTGLFPLSASALQKAATQARLSPFLQVLSLEGASVLIEPTQKIITVYLFGAGHVSQPTAHLAALVGFRVVVLDDREEFAAPDRFPEAAQVTAVKSFDQSFQELPVDRDSFIVIVTRGHLHDKEVLARALKTPAGYIGMIGSRRKRNAIYHVLLEEGFTQQDLNRVFSPIGLEIAAETPEEIAVSIAAELIKVRAGLDK